MSITWTLTGKSRGGVLCFSCMCIKYFNLNSQARFFSQPPWLFSYSQKRNYFFLTGDSNLSRQYVALVFSCFHYFFKWLNLSSKIYLRLLYHQLPGLLYTLLHVRRTGSTYLILINSTWLGLSLSTICINAIIQAQQEKATNLVKLNHSP